ncbi:DUF6538 domain-containing protein [Methylovorus mays]|uniref:DUF6538 domain-containing protein n=1 Tax=Methylovorus mays TaxID=184077 RepID=UPI0038994D72
MLGVQAVKTQTNLVRRGAVYYFRARFPSDLVDHYGRREILASLKTTDKREALCKARRERIRFDLELSQARASIASGNPVTHPVPSPTEPLLHPPESRQLIKTIKRPGDTLRALFDYWKVQGQKRPRSILEAETAINRLAKQTDGKAASEISKSDIVTFKDNLIANGKAPATVAKQINLLKAVFQTATDNDKLPNNPASKVKVPKPKAVSKARVPFSAKDLQKIFTSDIYTWGERPRAGAGEAAYWIWGGVLPLKAFERGPAPFEVRGLRHVTHGLSLTTTVSPFPRRCRLRLG